MKKLLLIGFFVTHSFLLAAQSPPPPPGRHGFTENHDTPLGSGMETLLVLGLGYVGKKAWENRKKRY